MLRTQGALTYDAMVRADVRQLAHDIIAQEGPARQRFNILVITAGLMRPPFLYGVLVKILCWRHKWSTAKAWLSLFQSEKIGDALSNDMIASTANWAANGRDAYSGESAGGFCQREVDFIARLLNTSDGVKLGAI
jgi:hypothetical protein